MRNNQLATIYDRVLRHEPLRKINIELTKQVKNSNIDDKSAVILLGFSLKCAKKAYKIANSYKKQQDIAENFALMIKNEHIFDKSIIVINEELRKQEEKDKKQYIKDLLDTKDIFYIASAHDDSAEDHKPYQGKVYVDRYWYQKTRSDEVRQYVKKNKIRTLQWVTGKPVWFVTRPHCRHYFIKVPVSKVLEGDFKVPHREVGERGAIQTPKGKTLAYYEERLKLYKKLYEVRPTQALKDLIVKTEILIQKWKK